MTVTQMPTTGSIRTGDQLVFCGRKFTVVDVPSGGVVKEEGTSLHVGTTQVSE